jgi:hypothetical protein
MKFDLSAHCVPGPGFVNVRLWNATDSVHTAFTLHYPINLSYTSACSNGISETEIGSISLSPNPVKSQLRLSLPQSLENGRIEIYNMLGSKVYQQGITGSRDMDMNNLETGIYIARIIENEKVLVTKRFTKVN